MQQSKKIQKSKQLYYNWGLINETIQKNENRMFVLRSYSSLWYGSQGHIEPSKKCLFDIAKGQGRDRSPANHHS